MFSYKDKRPKLLPIPSDIVKIQSKILEYNNNEVFFLPSNNNYSAATSDFKNFFTVYRNKQPILKNKLFLDKDYTLTYYKTNEQDSVDNQGQIVLFCNPDSTSEFQAILEFKKNAPLLIPFFPVILDKFLFTSNGMIYAASTILEEYTIYQVYINSDATNESNLDYFRISSNLSFNPDHVFVISTIKIPLAMSKAEDDKAMVHSIWNHKYLTYKNVEGKISQNTEGIRDGWFCQTGNYTRKDGQYMNCGDDNYGRFCIGENGNTEFLFDSDNNGYRCRSYRTCKSKDACLNGEDFLANVLINSQSADCGLDNQYKVWCDYSFLKLNENIDIANACAEGVGNINALPRDSTNNLISEDKLSYKKCKLNYSHTNDDRPVSEPTESWSPWSNATSSSEIYYNFCSEQDTTNNSPMYISNNNCQKWLQDDSTLLRLKKVKDLYCQKYPQNEGADCGTFCSDKTLNCRNTLSDFCQGSNLEYPECKKFAANPNVNLDQKLYEYCNTLGNEKAIANELCGCFMPLEFYSNYFNDLQDAVNAKKNNTLFNKDGKNIDLASQLSQLPKYPTCYYNKCALSNFLPYSEKDPDTKRTCPDVNQCVQVYDYDVTGKIDTNSITYGSESCVLKVYNKDDVVDCVTSDWSECINGYNYKSVLMPPQNGGKECGELKKSCISPSKSSSKTFFIIIIALIIVVLAILFVVFRK